MHAAGPTCVGLFVLFDRLSSHLVYVASPSKNSLLHCSTSLAQKSSFVYYRNCPSSIHFFIFCSFLILLIFKIVIPSQFSLCGFVVVAVVYFSHVVLKVQSILTDLSTWSSNSHYTLQVMMIPMVTLTICAVLLSLLCSFYHGLLIKRTLNRSTQLRLCRFTQALLMLMEGK